MLNRNTMKGTMLRKSFKLLEKNRRLITRTHLLFPDCDSRL